MKIREHTVDPISGNQVEDLERAPFLIEGIGSHMLKIYFESRDNRDQFAGSAVQNPQAMLLDAYVDDKERTPQ